MDLKPQKGSLYLHSNAHHTSANRQQCNEVLNSVIMTYFDFLIKNME